jgi:predicted phosphoadenosine phosphosulfate sulfurtransferase
MNKTYTDINVYEAAKQRLNLIFDEFDKVIVSFSGGKDSGVVLNMAIDIARQRKRKLGVMFLDLEAFYQKTIDYVEKMFFRKRRRIRAILGMPSHGITEFAILPGTDMDMVATGKRADLGAPRA